MIELVQRNNYLLLIDTEAEIKAQEYLLSLINNPVIIDVCTKVDKQENLINYYGNLIKWTSGNHVAKIIAYYPLTESVARLNLPYLPKLKTDVDIEEIANNIYREFPSNPKDKPEWTYGKDVNVHRKRKAFIKGYNLANAKQFTLDDLIAFGKKCFYKGFEKSENDDSNCYTAWREEALNLTQFLEFNLPKGFIPEYEDSKVVEAYEYDETNDGELLWAQKLKTITNSNGELELIGEYKY